MYVCICNGITEEMVEKVAKTSKSEKEILSRLGIGSSCGICVLDAISKITSQLKNKNSQKTPIKKSALQSVTK